MAIGTGVYIDAPTVTPLPGGLLAVANVVDESDPHARNGVAYLSEACGVASVVPGDNCGMLTVTVTATDADSAEFVFSGTPGGAYTITLDDGAPSGAVYGPNPSFTLDGLTAGPHTITLSSSGGSTWTSAEFTWPLTVGLPNVILLGEKTADGIGVVEGYPFSIYKMTECHDLHGDDTEWARNSLALGESHAVESGFMQAVLAQPTTAQPNGATAVSIEEGVAILEGYAADVYGGVPIIHMARSVATRALARDILVASMDYTVTTPQGALVANGGGYSLNLGPAGAAAPEGQAWLYVSGMVTLVRSPVEAHRVLDHTENNQVVLAERTYVPAVDCFVAAVLVNLEETSV
jgi:hypothetical protein